MKQTILKTLTLASLLAVSLPPAIVVMSASPSFAASAIDALDTDKDGTIDLAEAKSAVGALFDKLEKDNDGTLDHKELKGRISAADWEIADPDNDKTISKDEYLAFVEVAFKRADTDHEGTIEAKELKTPAGHALLRLLKREGWRSSDMPHPGMVFVNLSPALTSGARRSALRFKTPLRALASRAAWGSRRDRAGRS